MRLYPHCKLGRGGALSGGGVRELAAQFGKVGAQAISGALGLLGAPALIVEPFGGVGLLGFEAFQASLDFRTRRPDDEAPGQRPTPRSGCPATDPESGT